MMQSAVMLQISFTEKMMNYPTLTTMILLSTLTACGGSGGGSNNYDSSKRYYGEFPYDYPKFQDALDNADLIQNETTIKTASGYSGFSNNGFNIDETSYALTFKAEGENNHSKLRFINNFLTNDLNHHRLTATLLPAQASDSETESITEQQMTFLEVGNNDGYAPLIRITWDGEQRGEHSNSYWAIVNTGFCSIDDSFNKPSECYDYYYLTDFDALNATKFEIVIEDNELAIKVNESKLHLLNISNWANVDSYFTAGITNQSSNTESVVHYESLTYNTNLPLIDLNNNVAPADNFDLLGWYLSVPDARSSDGNATSISAKTLDAGYEHSSYFYTGADGGMVFICPIDGAKTSTNTSYTRTELRSMLSRGANTSTKSMGNNWVFSSAPASAQNEAAGIDGILEATLAVNNVTKSGDSDQVGRVIIGQIHANDDEPIRVYYRKLPNNSKGSIYFAHEPRNSGEKWINVIGSKGDNASNPTDGIALGEKFYYKIKVQGNLLSLTIKRDYKDDIIQTWDMSGSGFDDEDQYMYFKAGVYNQNKSGAGNDFVKATFYYLDNQHVGYNKK